MQTKGMAIGSFCTSMGALLTSQKQSRLSTNATSTWQAANATLPFAQLQCGFCVGLVWSEQHCGMTYFVFNVVVHSKDVT
jgi:hypothetical protein